jgi:hypothetical protein
LGTIDIGMLIAVPGPSTHIVSLDVCGVLWVVLSTDQFLAPTEITPSSTDDVSSSILADIQGLREYLTE